MPYEEIIKIFRLLAQEYNAVTDEEVKIYIDIAKPHVTKRLGDMYIQAMAYYVAHLICWNNLVKTSGGSTDGLTAGLVSGMREGDVQVNYGDARGVGAGGVVKPIDALDKTAYGMQFKAICRLKISGGITRMGGASG